MKTRLIALFVLFLLVSASIYAQIPNNSFENWTSMITYDTPDGWGNLNDATSSGGVFTCFKGTPGNPGPSFLKLISRNVPGMGVQPGIAVSGNLNTTSYQATSGFAFTDRSSSMTGNWQYMAYGSDQGYMAVYFTRWNSGSGQRDTVGMGYTALKGMVMTWSSFELPIIYSLGGLPDTAMIIFSASGNTPVNNSYFYVDNLSFSGSTVGIGGQKKIEASLILTSPVSQQSMKVDCNNRNEIAGYTEILDFLGRVIDRKELNNQHFPFSVDVSKLPSGTYFLRVGQQHQNPLLEKFIRL